MSRRPVTEFTARVRGVIRAIPRGRVMTYGAVALAAGSPRAARGVVWILHSSSETERLPWHRVVGAGGLIYLDPERGGELQRAMLEAEGIELGMRGAIDMDRYGFRPSPPRRGRETAGRPLLPHQGIYP